MLFAFFLHFLRLQIRYSGGGVKKAWFVHRTFVILFASVSASFVYFWANVCGEISLNIPPQRDPLASFCGFSEVHEFFLDPYKFCWMVVNIALNILSIFTDHLLSSENMQCFWCLITLRNYWKNTYVLDKRIYIKKII